MPKRFRRTRAWPIAVFLGVCLWAPLVTGADVETHTDIALRGLVFDQGRLSAGPHELSVVERDHSFEIIVSGIRLDRLALIEPTRNLEPITEPPPYEKPDGVTLLDDSGYPAYLYRLLDYHRQTVGDERALDRIEAHVRQSDLVRRYERLEDGLLLFDRNDTPYFVGEQPLSRRSPMSRSDVEALAERTLEAYRQLLDGGGAILHFANVDLFLPEARVADTLIPSLKVLEDPSAALETKRRRLEAYWTGSPVVEPFLRNYRSSPELRMILDHSRRSR